MSKKEGDIVIHSRETGFSFFEAIGLATHHNYEAEALDVHTNTLAKSYGDTKEEAEMKAAKNLAEKLEENRRRP